jgi:hypothetical protein
VLTKVGEVDLAFTCADRGERLLQDVPDLAESRSSAPLLKRCCRTPNYDDAAAVVDQTATQVPAQSSDPRMLSALGTLHLVGAMTAARMRDRPSARAHLDQAHHAADALGSDANHLWTAFGPTNVAIHEVAVAAELGDYQRAAVLGEPINVAPMPMERQVRHRLEVARALHFQDRHPDSLSLVLQAEAKAPDQVRRHYLTHALLHERIRNGKTAASASLHGLARRAGVLAA